MLIVLCHMTDGLSTDIPLVIVVLMGAYLFIVIYLLSLLIDRAIGLLLFLDNFVIYYTLLLITYLSSLEVMICVCSC